MLSLKKPAFNQCFFAYQTDQDVYVPIGQQEGFVEGIRTGQEIGHSSFQNVPGHAVLDYSGDALVSEGPGNRHRP